MFKRIDWNVIWWLDFKILKFVKRFEWVKSLLEFGEIFLFLGCTRLRCDINMLQLYIFLDHLFSLQALLSRIVSVSLSIVWLIRCDYGYKPALGGYSSQHSPPFCCLCYQKSMSQWENLKMSRYPDLVANGRNTNNLAVCFPFLGDLAILMSGLASTLYVKVYIYIYVVALTQFLILIWMPKYIFVIVALSLNLSASILVLIIQINVLNWKFTSIFWLQIIEASSIFSTVKK